MDLEDRIRRAAAERGAVELKKNEFKGELQKQREQIEKIQDLHNSQMENTNKIHRDEKVRVLLFFPSNSSLGSSSTYGISCPIFVELLLTQCLFHA